MDTCEVAGHDGSDIPGAPAWRVEVTVGNPLRCVCPPTRREQPVNTYDAMVFLIGIPMTLAACFFALTALRRAV
jgi:hypothetical protein